MQTDLQNGFYRNRKWRSFREWISELRNAFGSALPAPHPHFRKGAHAWSGFSILISLGFLLSGCGEAPFDITSETDREAMKVEIRNALTRADCSGAVDLSVRLYESEYSDNEIRMLHASALGCKAGIKLYSVVDELTSFGGANPIGQFARIFPSALSDQRLERRVCAGCTSGNFEPRSCGGGSGPRPRRFEQSGIGSLYGPND